MKTIVMKKIILPFVLLIALSFSCQEENTPSTACQIENPLQEMDWLKVIIENLEGSSLTEYMYISQATRGSSTVFLVQNCCPFCNTVTPVYNCEGVLLGILGSGENGIDPTTIKNSKVIWKSENFSCNI